MPAPDPDPGPALPGEVELESARLLLRRITLADTDLLLELDADPEVRRYVHQPRAPTRAEVVAWVLAVRAGYARHPGLGYWAAVERGAGEFLGWFHLRPVEGDAGALELGYRLRRAAWGRGYATEGAEALVRHAFATPGVRRVVASALAAHAASIRVMEKAGLPLRRRFLHEGIPAVEHALERPG